MDIDHARAATLEWVNALRADREIGPPLEELPAGIPDNGCRCPIAIALNAQVGKTEVSFYDFVRDESEELSLPLCAADFVRNYDQHYYDDLIDWDAYQEENG